MSYLDSQQQAATKVQLDYALASDVSVTPGSWTDVISNQTFTVDDPSSVVEISVSGNATTSGDGSTMTTRIVVDSATTNITKFVGGDVGSAYDGAYNPFAGSSPIPLTGLVAGSHTVKLQVYYNGGPTPSFAIRPATYPNLEFLYIRVLERKVLPSIFSGPQPTTKVQLDYEPTTDIINGTSIPATTWTDIISNQTFNVDDPNSVIEVEVSGVAMMGNTTNGFQSAIRINVDSGGTPVTKLLSGSAFLAPGANAYQNTLAGAGTITLTGLNAGSHTINLQIYQSCITSLPLYCRPASFPNVEFLSVRVLERKQTAALVSNTMVKLAEVIVGVGGQVTIAFNSIDQRYRNLRLVVTGRSDAAGVGAVSPKLQFNSDTGANYSRSYFQAYDTGTGNGKDTAQTSIDLGIMAAATATANVPGILDVEIFNYTNTSFYKGCRSLSGYFSGGYNEQWVAGMWASTSAITSILLFPASGNFVQGSVASLYGIT